MFLEQINFEKLYLLCRPRRTCFADKQAFKSEYVHEDFNVKNIAMLGGAWAELSAQRDLDLAENSIFS